MSELLTIKECALLTGKSESLIYRYIRQNKLKVHIIKENTEKGSPELKKIYKEDLLKAFNLDPGHIVEEADKVMEIQQESEIRDIIEEVLSVHKDKILKPLEEESLYRAGLLSGENRLLKERIKDLEEENSLLKKKFMALPSLIEKTIDKIKVSDRGVKSERDRFYFPEAGKIGEERTSPIHALRVKMFDLFKKIPLFSRLGERELHYLLEKTFEKNYGRDSIILQRGDKSGFLGVLISGELKVTMLSPEGREMTLDILKPYCAIGEMSLLDDEPHSATVIAMKKSRLLILQREPFLELLKMTPETCLYLLKIGRASCRERV